MTRRLRLVIWLVIILSGLGLIIFLLGPTLFASIAYPLPSRYQTAIAKYAQEYNLSPNFLAALIAIESNWNPSARSTAGALGLTQVIPSTGRAIATRLGVKDFDPSMLISNPELAIRFGAYYVSEAIRRNGGNKKLGLIAYNSGQGGVMAYQYGSPIRGTVAYANNVIAVEKIYQNIYGQWWDRPEFNPRSNTGQPSVPIIEFWRTLLYQGSTEQRTGSAELLPDLTIFWQNLLSRE